jgi:hypothetical protein
MLIFYGRTGPAIIQDSEVPIMIRRIALGAVLALDFARERGSRCRGSDHVEILTAGRARPPRSDCPDPRPILSPARDMREPPFQVFDAKSKCQDMNSLTGGGGANVEHASDLNGPERT